jgi:predicted transcriptional regulator of viral defense system
MYGLERDLRNYLLGTRPAIYSTATLRQTFPTHPSVSIQAALRRLVAAGEVARVARGRYTAIDPATSSPTAHAWAQALAPFRTAAIAGYSALSHWQLTTQLPSVIDVAVLQGLHHRPSYSSITRVRLIVVPPAEWFGVLDEWIADGERVSMFSRPRILFDMFIRPARYGGWGNAMETLHMARHELDIQLKELTDTAALSHSPLAIRRYLRGLREVYGDQLELEQLATLAEQRQAEK